MSNAPVVGYDGLITIGSTPVTVNKVTKWTHSSKRDKTENGPWVGDANKVTTIGGKLGSMKLEGDVIDQGDLGVTAISTAYEAGTNPPLSATCENGYQVVYSAPAYLSFEIAVDSTKGQTWSAELEGAYTVTQDT